MENNVIANQERVPLSWLPKVEDSTLSVETLTKSERTEFENCPKREELEQNGKPGRPVTVKEAYRHILLRDGPLKYAETIANDAVTAKSPRDRLAAFTEMTDRLEGKATQTMRMAGVFMVAAPDAGVLESVFGAELDE